MMLTYRSSRGEPFPFPLLINSGDLSAHTALVRFKPFDPAAVDIPGDDVAHVAEITGEYVPAESGEVAQFAFSLSAAQTLALPAGRYIFDAKLSLGGAVELITDPAILILSNAVSA